MTLNMLRSELQAAQEWEEQAYTVTLWADHQCVRHEWYSTEKEARTAARAWAGPKQDRAYATFAELIAYYTEKHPKGWGKTAMVAGPGITTLLNKQQYG